MSLFVLLVGCYEHHRIEHSDAAPDVRPTFDPNVGPYWILESRAAATLTVVDGVDARAGAMLLVTVAIERTNTCEFGAPVVVQRDGSAFVVTARVWARRPFDERLGCSPVTDTIERLADIRAPPGRYRVVDSQADDVVITVDFTEEGRESCAECRYGCLARDGERACVSPCDLTGLPTATSQCDVFEHCEDGEGFPSCVESESAETLLPPTPGGGCTTDADCEAGLRCTQLPFGARWCSVPCFTRRTRCPMFHTHACEIFGTGPRAICEWTDGE